MKEFNVPVELEEELNQLNKRDKLYSWLLIGLVAIIGILSVKAYMGQSAENYLLNSSNVVSGKPLANNSTNQGAAASGGCCGAGSTAASGAGASGGCGNGGGCGSGKATNISNPELEQEALELYKSEAGNKEGIKALVTDYGCHQQVDIVDNSKNLLKSYRYQGGQLSPVG